MKDKFAVSMFGQKRLSREGGIEIVVKELCTRMAQDNFIDKVERKEMEKKEIPHIIHYCWFGGKPLPEQYKKYVETWKKNFPDYKVMKWDESNFPIDQYSYATVIRRKDVCEGAAYQ